MPAIPPPETAAALLEQIKVECPKKKVLRLCNQLIKHFSFGSSKDASNLCNLSYWLYIYDRTDLAIQCIALTHGLEFNHDFRVWGNVHAMWGLEIRILRAQGKQQEADAIAAQIDAHLLLPNKISTPERHPKREMARRQRFVIGKENDQGTGFIEVSYQVNVEVALKDGRLSSANSWRLNALSRLIGDTETGLYPPLTENRERVEQTITEYMADLQKIK
ncbi:MAG: hypothetical protein LBJ12_07250 [Oscillospiraceae bacterium]|nr:hypothetical protein [Oscillospiraceae bacterium]